MRKCKHIKISLLRQLQNLRGVKMTHILVAFPTVIGASTYRYFSKLLAPKLRTHEFYANES